MAVETRRPAEGPPDEPSETSESPGPPGGLTALLDAFDARADATALRERSSTLLDLAPGDTVVDAGCGTGLAAAEPAARGAVAIGADPDEGAVRTARERHPGPDFWVAAAERLPLPDGAVAGYRADKVLHALTEPADAVAEARRVLRPGGRAVLLGQDWDLASVDAEDRALTGRILRARADAVAGPDSARTSRRMLLDAGFDGVGAEAHAVLFTEPAFLPMVTGAAPAAVRNGAVDAEEAAGWLRDLRQRAAAGRFLAVAVFVVAWGRAPRR